MLCRSFGLTMSAAEEYVNDLLSLDWEAGILQVWRKVIQILHGVNLENEVDKKRIEDKLLPVLNKLINPEQLRLLWTKILSLSVEVGSSEGTSLLNGHRLIANVLQLNLPSSLHHQAYLTDVLRALMEAIRDTVDINPYTVEGVIDNMTDSSVSVFLEEIVLGDQEDAVMSLLCGLMNPVWLLNASKTILKLLLRAKNGENVGFNAPFRALVRSAVERGVSASEVVDTLVLAFHTSRRHVPRSVYSTVASIIVESVPNTAMAEVLDAALFVWSDKLFVSRADVPKITYLTEVVLAALGQTNRRQLSVTGSRNMPIELVLSMGISNYLEVDNVYIRVHGMRVAQGYAKVIGEPLHFAELDVIDAEEARRESLRHEGNVPSSSSSSAAQRGGRTVKTSRTGGSSNGAGAKANATQNDTSDTHAHTSVGYDTDSSEELVGYDDVAEEDHTTGVFDYKDKLLNTNYLRDCLLMLRCPEAKPEARQQLHAALLRIPVIMASNPPDARDLCVPLTKELLTVANAYNIENFDALRTTAVLSLVTHHPEQTIPNLTTSLQGQELPLGLKLIVLDWFMAAARELSDIPELQQLESGDDLSTAGKSSSVATRTKEADSQKVRIKRPGVLANAKKRTRYFRNDFGPLAHLFIYPLMSILGKVWNNTLTEPLLPRAGEQFNLISEMFEPAKQTPLSAPPGEEASAVKDLSLSHLDGVDALLPSQCLVALGLFARCAVNTVNQREHALQVIKAASAFRAASAVSLRRAALYALRLAMEAYLPSPVSRSANTSAAMRAQLNRGPLDSLLHISEPEADFGTGMDGSEAGNGMSDAAAISIMNQPVIVDCVDWAASTWKEDADEVSRTLKHEIVRIAVEGLS